VNWDAAIDGWLGVLEANADVQSVLGNPPAIYMAEDGEREYEVNSMEYTVLTDTEDELYNPTLVQLDLFVKTMADLETLERAIRTEAHLDLPGTFGSISMWSQFEGSGRLAGVPDGLFSRSLDFRLTPVRS
jgi:hypothetical protein